MFLLFAFNVIFVVLTRFTAAEKMYPADEARDALMKNILNNYNPSVRPAQANETVMLIVNMEVQHFDFKESTGAFHLVGQLHVKWRDPKLVWDPQSYGNMSHILIGQKYIWIPDLEFYNNAPDRFIQMNSDGYVSVKNNGVVFWSDTIELNLFCSADMKNWPHDTHECVSALGSWTFHGFEVDMMHLEPNSTMTFSSVDMKNMEYKITKYNASHVKKIYPCCVQPYVSMDYYIKFERRSSYAVIFRVPALTIILFTLVALKLETNRREKIWLNCLSFILISWQLLYFPWNIGHFHGTPNLVIFFSTCIILVTAAQLLAIFSLFANYSKFKGSLPRFIDNFSYCSLNRYLVPIESKNSDRDEVNVPHEQIKLDDTSNLIHHNLLTNDWLRLAKILNILGFFIYGFIFLVLTSVCLV